MGCSENCKGFRVVNEFVGILRDLLWILGDSWGFLGILKDFKGFLLILKWILWDSEGFPRIFEGFFNDF